MEIKDGALLSFFFFLAGQYINIITLINTLDYVNI